MKDFFIRSSHWLFLYSLDRKLDSILIYEAWVEPFIRVRLNFLLVLASIATISAIPVNQMVIEEHPVAILIIDCLFHGMILFLLFLNRSPIGERLPQPLVLLGVMCFLEFYGLFHAFFEESYINGLIFQIIFHGLLLPAYIRIHTLNVGLMIVATVFLLLLSPSIEDWEIMSLFLISWAGIIAVIAVYFLEDLGKRLLAERRKSEALLANTLPQNVIHELKMHGESHPQRFDEVSVFLSDLLGFTHLSAQLSPNELINELSLLFSEFDDIMARHGCERIKTIGDAYMAVCGMASPRNDHAQALIHAALDIVNYLKARNKTTSFQWEIRIGIHSGPIVGGIVGKQKYLYDIFGDTVNLASRLETHSEPMRINVSEQVYQNAKPHFDFEARGEHPVKGKGNVLMYFMRSIAISND